VIGYRPMTAGAGAVITSIRRAAIDGDGPEQRITTG